MIFGGDWREGGEREKEWAFQCVVWEDSNGDRARLVLGGYIKIDDELNDSRKEAVRFALANEEIGGSQLSAQIEGSSQMDGER